ncbi:MAG: hypothetical protein HYY17_12870 [Planctomycetes bacterium]|nr:hypothetical protein [Planctomycetota bacterium]
MQTCPNCGASFEGPACGNCDLRNVDDPDRRPDSPWVAVYSGERKWELVIRRALENAGIAVRHQAVETDNPYYRLNIADVALYVPQPDEARALDVLAALKEKIPEAFPEGTL